MPKQLFMATLSTDDLANGVIAIASREPQWDGMSAKQRTTLITNILGEVAATATAKVRTNRPALGRGPFASPFLLGRNVRSW